MARKIIKNKTVGWIIRLAAALLVIVLVLAAGLVFFVRSEYGAKTIARTVSDMASSESFSLEVSGLGGRFPWDIHIDQIRMGDEKGTWLEISGLELVPDLPGLFKKRLDIHRLAVDRIELSRLPASKKTDSKPFRPDWKNIKLPGISAGDISIDELVIGPQIATTRRTFTAFGTLGLRENRGHAQFNLKSLTGPEERVFLAAGLTDKVPDLRLHLVFHEDAGGLAGKMAGLSESSALDASLHGVGPLSDWNGKLAASVSGLGGVDTRIGISAGDRLSFDLDGGYKLAEGIVPEPAVEMIDRQGEFSVRVSLDADNRLKYDGLRFVSGKTRLTSDGLFEPETGRIDGTFSLTASVPSNITESIGLDIREDRQINGAITGTVKSPQIRVTSKLGPIEAKGVSTENTTVEISAGKSGDGSDAAYKIAAKVDAKAVRVTGVLEEPTDVVTTLGVFTSDFKMIKLNRFDLDGGWTRTTASGFVNLDNKTFDAIATAAVTDPDRLNRVSGGKIKARAELELKAKGNFSKNDITATLQGTASDLEGLPEQVRPLVGPKIKVSAGARTDGDTVYIKQFSIDSASKLTATGDVNITARKMDLDWKLTAPGLTQLASGYGVKLSEPAPIEGRVSGPFDKFNLTVKTAASSVRASGRRIDGLDVRLDAKGLPSDIQGALDLAANFQGGGISLNTGFSYAKDMFNLSGLKIGGPGTTIGADLAINTKNSSVAGRVSAAVSDFSKLKGLIGVDASGSLSADFSLTADKGRVVLTGKGTGENLGFGPVRAAGLSLDVERLNVTGLHADRAEVVLTGFKYQEAKLEKVTLGVSGSPGQAGFNVQAAGEWVRPLDIQAQGALIRSGSRMTVKFDRFRGKFDGIPIQLKSALTVKNASGHWDISGLDLRVGSGNISGNGTFGGREPSAAFRFDALPLSVANSFSSVKISGSLSGDVSLAGTMAKPVLQSNIRVRGFRPVDADFEGLPKSNIDLKLNARQPDLRAEATFTGLGKQPGTARIAAPLVFSLRPFRFSLPPSGSIDGRLDATVNMGLIPLVLGLDDQRISGTVKANLDLTGTVGKPHIAGDLAIRRGRYENVKLGMVLNDVSADMTADGGKFRVTTLTGTDGERGRFDLKGEAEINAQKKHPYQFKLRLNEMHLIRLELFNAHASGELDLTGNASGGKLAGGLTINEAEFRIPQTLPPSITEVEVKEINTGRPPKKEYASKKQSPFKLAMDVSVDAPARVFLRGRGLEAEWGGALRVGGTSSSPVISGKLSVRRGDFDFLDRRFRFVSGSITFSGGSPPSPWISAVTETRVKDVDIQVEILGPVSRPDFELNSTPALPQDEIMARILFGRTMASITPLQAVTLGLSIKKLTGGKSMLPDFMGKTREILGIDRLEIGRGESGGATVGVGKYIHEKVYVEAEKGTAPGEDKARVEVDLGPNLGMESEIGSDGEGGIQFNWKLDY